MTLHGAQPLARRSRALSVSGIAFGVAVLAGAAMGTGILARPDAGTPRAATSPADPHPAGTAASRDARHVAGLRVVAPPVPTTAEPARGAPPPPPVHHDNAVRRHSHLFDHPVIAEASSFALDAPVRVAAFEPAEPAAAAPAAVVVARVEPAKEMLGPPMRPATAEEALEAALVPTPRARPAYRTIMAAPPAARAKPAPLLAYARPDAGAADEDDLAPSQRGLFRMPAARPAAGNGVAIYDISAATVYMPNGERLEAHSGLGSLRDDVRYVHVGNRGATPPHTYDLTLRESLFHGVAAIRLHPVGGQRRIFNRVGLLAHTYMLGKRGDSNGCVSFKNYDRFLAAFRRGEVKRLVVVKRMDPVSRIASLFRAKD